jgi:hypothetical protein
MRNLLSVAAVFRNEAPYLKEWIEFHRLVGCDHFYLLNNLSTDDYLKVLDPYIKRGIVDLFSWPIEHQDVEDWNEIQVLGLNRALHFAKNQTKWLAILDTDEFLFPSKEDLLPHCLSKYEKYGGVGVNWQVFGTSKVAKIPKDRLLIEMLHLKLPESEQVNHRIKSIVQPEHVESILSPHHVNYLPGYFQVNTDQIPFNGESSPYVQIDTLRINHYRLRDEDYLRTQKLARTLKWWNAHSAEKWLDFYDTFNQVHDESIFRFIRKFKIA